MKNRIIAIALCILLVLPFAALGVSATESTTATTKAEYAFELTLDVNKRETDISFAGEGLEDLVINSDNDQTDAQKTSNKIIYICVLLVLLVIAIVILFVTIKRAPEEAQSEEASEETKQKNE